MQNVKYGEVGMFSIYRSSGKSSQIRYGEKVQQGCMCGEEGVGGRVLLRRKGSKWWNEEVGMAVVKMRKSL